MSDRKEVSIHFPDKHVETMLMRSIDSANSVVQMLRERGSIRIDNCQLDIEDYFEKGGLDIFDSITGNHIVSARWK